MCARVCRVDSDPFFPLEAEDLIADSRQNERGGSGSSLGESTAFDSATCSLGGALSYAVLSPNLGSPAVPLELAGLASHLALPRSYAQSASTRQ